MRSLCILTDVSKSSFYYEKNKKENNFTLDTTLLKEIKTYIKRSRNSVGRDATHEYLKSSFNISTYEFRRHWESLEYKSNYHPKYNRKPREKKYKGMWTSDKVKFNFKTKSPNEIWYSDISYIKANNEWHMIFLIKDGFDGRIHYLKLINDRKATIVIKIVKETARWLRTYPKIFHTDHGIEYANYKFKEFLENNDVIQSMSPKCNSLGNRPAEFLFSCLKREFIYPFKNSIKNISDLKTILSSYKNWYHYYRL